jgi:endonuclease YncB( thermonuclease family)
VRTCFVALFTKLEEVIVYATSPPTEHLSRDGDTITMLSSNTQYKIRLYGIDTPEMPAVS